MILDVHGVYEAHPVPQNRYRPPEFNGSQREPEGQGLQGFHGDASASDGGPQLVEEVLYRVALC